MPTGRDVRFGPCRLDLTGLRLLREGVLVLLQPRLIKLLALFVEHAGELLTKDTIVKTIWQGTAVTDASLTQAIYRLRDALDSKNPERYIETVARIGYRFIAPVERVRLRHTDEDIDALLSPHRAMLDGRAALEQLDLHSVDQAREIFQTLVNASPDEPTFRVGLATACVLRFEATRTDEHPDRESLQLALGHASEACRLNPHYGEAWATLGFVLERTSKRKDAVGALLRAVSLEPGNWRHHVRLAYGTWGEARLGAARRALELFPGCAMARWLAATVYIARGALAEAERYVDQGLAAAALEAERGDGRFSAIGLHLLKGLLHLNRNEIAEAHAAFERELALEGRRHVYGRELSANAWYAIGVCGLRQRDAVSARRAFGEALSRVPRHPLALVGLVIVDGLAAHAGSATSSSAAAAMALLARPADAGRASAADVPIEVTFARAAGLRATQHLPAAVALVRDALSAAPPGSGGWTLALEPLLAVSDAPAAWADALHVVSARAT